MNFYPIKIPKIVQYCYPNRLWRIKGNQPKLYLTFDDGPIPEITPWVLEQLSRYEALATFFCVGENIERHPDIFKQILKAGHAVGNHTFNHLNGWKSPNTTYFENVKRCQFLTGTKLFRPPYGKLKSRQAKELQKDYTLVMWDVLSGDFDSSISGEKCLENVLRHTKSGSIIVFHDSQKAFERLKYALPRMLEHYSKRGYKFEPLEP